MKRLVLAGLLLGTVDGLAAALALYVVDRSAPEPPFGWFAYAPLDGHVVLDHDGFRWQYVVVPAVLLVLNALLLPLAVRRGRLQV